jgi:hypothetical protein
LPCFCVINARYRQHMYVFDACMRMRALCALVRPDVTVDRSCAVAALMRRPTTSTNAWQAADEMMKLCTLLSGHAHEFWLKWPLGHTCAPGACPLAPVADDARQSDAAHHTRWRSAAGGECRLLFFAWSTNVVVHAYLSAVRQPTCAHTCTRAPAN